MVLIAFSVICWLLKCTDLTGVLPSSTCRVRWYWSVVDQRDIYFVLLNISPIPKLTLNIAGIVNSNELITKIIQPKCRKQNPYSQVQTRGSTKGLKHEYTSLNISVLQNLRLSQVVPSRPSIQFLRKSIAWFYGCVYTEHPDMQVPSAKSAQRWKYRFSFVCWLMTACTLKSLTLFSKTVFCKQFWALQSRWESP